MRSEQGGGLRPPPAVPWPPWPVSTSATRATPRGPGSSTRDASTATRAASSFPTCSATSAASRWWSASPTTPRATGRHGWLPRRARPSRSGAGPASRDRPVSTRTSRRRRLLSGTHVGGLLRRRQLPRAAGLRKPADRLAPVSPATSSSRSSSSVASLTCCSPIATTWPMPIGMRERFGARVWIHEADRTAAPYATDVLRGHQPATVAPGVVAVRCPDTPGDRWSTPSTTPGCSAATPWPGAASAVTSRRSAGPVGTPGRSRRRRSIASASSCASHGCSRATVAACTATSAELHDRLVAPRPAHVEGRPERRHRV